MAHFEPFSTKQVDVTGSATPLLPENRGRAVVLITNTSTTDFWVGDSTVSPTTGQLIPGTKGANISIPTTGAIYGITAGGTVTVCVMEVVE